MADTMTSAEEDRWHWFWPWALGLVVLLTLAIRYAEPVRDGDLWWQMAYGHYLIEHRTLIPDHTVFTWTPADNATIYCAWLSEIFLYLLYQAGNLPALFVFRYSCLLIFVLTVWLQALRLGVAGHPMTWLICLLGVLMSQSAAFIKPEIFSYVLMTLTVLAWWHIKSSGETAWRTCYLFPVLMVVWVNSHGGFIFGALFLCVMGFGETLNAFCLSKEALSPRVRRHLFVALFLSGLAIFVTPYGWRYPAYLIPALLGKSTEGLRVVNAYASALDRRAFKFHYATYLISGGLIFLGLLWPDMKRRRLDWAVLLTNLTFALLYIRFLRTTYYWAPVFSLSAVHLLAQRGSWLWPKGRAAALALGGVIALACVFLGGRAGFDAACRPHNSRWLGFGISYQNPVEEADFVKTHLSAYRLGNDYTSGGYLLWALWPKMKIMIDPRQFPFKGWIDQYAALQSGRNIKGFFQSFPCEVWCIRYKSRLLIGGLLHSPDWRVAFYGPSAVVFVRKDVAGLEGKPRTGEGIGSIKNLRQAQYVLQFAARIRDWDGARTVLTGMRERFRCPDQKSKIQAASDWLEGRIGNSRRKDEGLGVATEG